MAHRYILTTPKTSIILTGKTGTGKSTLINQIAGREVCPTQGNSFRPTTMGITEHKVGDVSYFDTRGLECQQYARIEGELRTMIISREKTGNPNEFIHMAYICIEDCSTVQECDISLSNFLASHMKVLIVITKAYSPMASGESKDFLEAVQKSIKQPVLRVNSIRKEIGGHPFEAHGIGDLVNWTLNSSGAAQQQAYAMAADARHLSLNWKKKIGGSIVITCSGLGGGAAALPIPILDLILAFAIIPAMVAGLNKLFGVEMSKMEIMEMLTTGLGISLSIGAIRLPLLLVAEALQFIPVVGQLAGGAIAAPIVASFINSIGNSQLNSLIRLYEVNPHQVPKFDQIVAELKKIWNARQNQGGE